MNNIKLNGIQYKFWMDNQLKYPSAEYNNPNFTFIVKGNLSLTLLEDSYRKIMQEYPPFCSIIKVINSFPCFVYEDSIERVPLFVIDNLRSHEEIKNYINKAINTPFDLEKEFPCRFYVIRYNDTWYVVNLFNHVVMDGLDLQVFFDRTAEIYNELRDGKYTAKSQLQSLNQFNLSFDKTYQEHNADDVKFWRNHIKDFPLRLPIHYTSDDKHRPFNRFFKCGADLRASSDKFCKAYNTTPFRLFASVWALTLARTANVDKLLVDHTINFRPKDDKTLLGVFVNNLPMKFDFTNADMNILDIINDVATNRKLERLYPNAVYSDILHSETSSKMSEAINVAVSYPSRYNKMYWNLKGCEVKPYGHVDVQVSADLAIIIEDDTDLTCDIRYNPLIDVDFINSLSNVFIEILKQVTYNPEIKIKDLELISCECKKQLLNIADKSLKASSKPTSFVNLFKNCADNYPDNIAIEYEDKKLTYTELNYLSDCVASMLYKQGCHNKRIALCTPKNQFMAVGIIGILKSNNTYVPIDYEHPKERIDFILDDCNVNTVLVTHDTHISFSITALNIEDLINNHSNESNDVNHSLTVLCPDKESLMDEAYIIYTSGTTGKPKGIPISHAAMCQTICSNVHFQQLDVHSRVLQFINICFDASVAELFPVLTVGGSLVIPKEEVRKDSKLLVSYLNERDITSVSFPAVLLGSIPRVSLPKLKTIVIGGDVTSAEVMAYWSKNHRLFNAYGPTECAVEATYHLVEDDINTNNIGLPMPGVTCYVVDKYMHLMPDNTIGELCIGGVTLTKGYINRDALNKEKFVDNPFVSDYHYEKQLNTRLYKTGDLVMRRNDGSLIFCGRTDFQVKFHGFRIELGAIETKIREYNNTVKNAIVIIHGTLEDQKLVAYIETDNPDTYSVADLRNYLKQSLPLYMIPSKFILLKNFIYNSSSKVDRTKLPDPALYEDEKRMIVEPQTQTEKKLVSLWKKLLPTDKISRYDDFISLGGDSMGIIQLTFGIEELFNISIRASEIYEYSSICKLGEYIDKHQSYRIETSETTNTHDKPVVKQPLSSVQMSLWLQCAQSDNIKDAYNLPCFFRCPDNVSACKLEKGINLLVSKQEGFRMFFPLDDKGKPYIKVSEYTPVKLEQIYVASEEELGVVFNQRIRNTFDFEHAPLFNCVLITIQDGASYCLIIMHHLISDGWSAKLIKNTLLDYISDKPVQWDKMSEGYTKYVSDELKFINSDAYENRLKFWSNKLRGVIDIELFNKKHEANDNLQGSFYVLPLPEGLNNKVLDYCSSRSYTPFCVYISIYLYLIARLSNKSNFAVGFPYMGRERSGYNNIIGYFINTLPLIYKREYGDFTFADYLDIINKELIEIRANAVSVDKLVNIARNNTDNNCLALIQSMFAYEDEELFYRYLKHDYVSFPLSFIVISDNKNSYCRIEYRTNVFSKQEIASLASAFVSLTESVMSNDTEMLKHHSLASSKYIKQVLRGNCCSDSLPTDAIPSFLQCFSKIVESMPEHTAAVYKDLSITYKQLDAKSDIIANNIRKQGIVSSVGVAVNINASINAIITIIGVLKAGCYYIPIDEQLPSERRQFILNDSSSVMLFTNKNFPNGELLSSEKYISHSNDNNKYAYIIYTSGTSGKPKGVPIMTDALSHITYVEREAFNLKANSRVLLFSSVSFDASVTEIFTTLSAGASLIIADEEQRKDLHKLSHLLLSQRVTCATIPPALLPLMPRRDFPDLQTLIAGGESANPDLLRQWSHNTKVINAYGPTENTVDTCLCVVNDKFEPDDIGIPLPGVTCYVLDDNLNIMPPFMEGELYIGGLQLTPGYLNRNNLNEEKFIDNPFVLDKDKNRGLNTKLYRSGDIVICRNDGHLIFKGRKDRQVKLHGFRIELQEIEKQLLNCDGVDQAFVEIRHCKDDNVLNTNDNNNQKDELVAFVQSSKAVNPILLQTQLRNKLPIYMIPSRWSVVDRFPITVNGKIDKKALPEPIFVLQKTNSHPESILEENLLTLVQDFFKTDSIEVDTDLLELGISSLQILELVAYVTENSTFNINLTTVYNSRTVRNLARDCSHKLYLWANKYNEEKPTFIFICGFPYLHPFFDEVISFLSERANVFIMESFFEFFKGNVEVSMDNLLDHYTSVIKTQLKDIPIFAITGFCMGAEIAIRLASRLKNEEGIDTKVLMLEGAYERRVENDIFNEVVSNKTFVEQGAISSILIETYKPVDFNGDLIIVLSQNIGDKVTPLDTNISQEQINIVNKSIRENHKQWKKAFPNAPFVILDADHWTFFNKENLDLIWNMVETNWNIKQFKAK